MKLDPLPESPDCSKFPLVALGEMHGVEQGADFIVDVVRHPLFAARINAIVVEFGNAFHQTVADAYVAGADVPMRDAASGTTSPAQRAHGEHGWRSTRSSSPAFAR